jgi:hypothetical protein
MYCYYTIHFNAFGEYGNSPAGEEPVSMPVGWAVIAMVDI